MAAPGTVVLGLLYYFGSSYTDAYYSWFGVPSSDLQLSVQGYLAKSPPAIFLPVWILLITGIVLLLLFVQVRRVLAGPGNDRRRRTAARWILGVGLLMVALGFPVFLEPHWAREGLRLVPQGVPRQLLPSLVVALGATLAIFALRLRWGRDGADPDRSAPATKRLLLMAEALLMGVLTMSLFFDAARYATMAGQSDAQSDASGGFEGSPGVAVYSRVPIVVDVPGVALRDMGSRKGPYRFRYTGFVILAKSSARFYLVSHQWQSSPVTVVVPDDDSIRVVVSPL
ncbi:hypothetical protein ABZX75_28295 [Streptomyces sp. NPDC003038]|uniref:hypothetical protein n=1 Tax=unclassified Streptomyces TaxID=2593676 RepID=UPI0033A66074